MEKGEGVQWLDCGLCRPETLAEMFKSVCDFVQTVYIYSGCQTKGDGCSVIAVFNGERESR